MGLTKADLEKIILLETMATTMAATIIGYALSYVEVLGGMSLLVNTFEM